MRFEEMDERRKRQVEGHVTQFERGRDYSAFIPITTDFRLEHYSVSEGVFQSDKMTAVEFARWIAYNNGEYYRKRVIDMFCGGGIQGIVALLRGAEHVTFVDHSDAACRDARKNLTYYKLEDRATVVQSDLFDKVQSKADLIIANPPFFPCEPMEGKPISATMCLPTEKAEEFYSEARDYALRMAVCHWDFAGEENDPENLAPKFGWNVERRLYLPIGYGLQQASNSDKEYYFKVNLLKTKA